MQTGLWGLWDPSLQRLNQERSTQRERVTMATANELRQILKEDAAGKNLYDHLTETLMRICLDRPSNAYDAFELISANIKANPLNPDPQSGQSVPPSAEEVC